jgi:hypothetical protein
LQANARRPIHAASAGGKAAVTAIRTSTHNLESALTIEDGAPPTQ